MDFPKEYQVKNSKANQLLQLSYAASVAFTQAIATFASVRAEQVALSNMTDKQLKTLMPSPTKTPIGFVNSGRVNESR
jgi:hypothetical protein